MSSNDILREILKISGSETAFGESLVAQLEPQAGWTFNYNIHPDLITVTTANGGTVTQVGSDAVLQTGTNPAGRAKIETKRAVRYFPGFGIVVRFTRIWAGPIANAKQYQGVGDDDDGYFYGYNGERFGAMRRRGGVDTWYYQDEDWNINKKEDFIYDNGNVFQIKYQWLGYGMQFWSMEAPDGSIQDVLRVEYANKNTDVSVFNPSFPIMAEVVNEGNTSNVIGRTPSAMAATEGMIGLSPVLSQPYAVDGEKLSISTNTDIPIVTLRNNTTYSTKTNRLRLIPTLIGLGINGNKVTRIRLIKNGTLTGASYVDYDVTRSPAQYDITATAITGGVKVAAFGASTVADKDINVIELRLDLNPGETLTIVARSTGAADVVGTINFISQV